jgi:mannose-6-phosphate isomerase-like protein (cupin superfamily)
MVGRRRLRNEEARMDKVNLEEKFGTFDERWSPKIVGTVNDSHVKIAKVQGQFVWHHHADEDEMFLVVRGRLVLKMHEGDVTLEEGEMFVVPKGVEHLPVAPEETWILMVEPRGTLNTGNIVNERTVAQVEEI